VSRAGGEICVNTLKKDWRQDVALGHIFSVIRCLLINPFPESALNEEAAKLFMEDYAEYAKQARLMCDIHARPKLADRGDSNAEGGASSAAHAGSSSADALQQPKKQRPEQTADKRKQLEKKKSLKRL